MSMSVHTYKPSNEHCTLSMKSKSFFSLKKVNSYLVVYMDRNISFNYIGFAFLLVKLMKEHLLAF